jgi:hypothetical protein
MKKRLISRRYYQLVLIAFLLLFAAVSCFPLAANPAQTPAITVVEVNREVTRIVVREITRIVEVPVTITPTPGPTITNTLAPTHTSAATPSSAETAVPAAVTVQIHTECLYGPDPVYLGRYEILAASPQAAIGRSADGTWLDIKGSDHKYPCWVKTAIVKVNSGSLEALPVVQPDLSPYSSLYPPPAAVSTNRVGNDVTIFWLPVPMTEADYHGYLIEAWICQGGKQVFVPLGKSTTFDDMAMKAVKVTDEAGCSQPSSARIYTVNTESYSTWKTVPWAARPTTTP